LRKASAAVLSTQGEPGLTMSPATARSNLAHSSGLAQNLANYIVESENTVSMLTFS